MLATCREPFAHRTISPTNPARPDRRLRSDDRRSRALNPAGADRGRPPARRLEAAEKPFAHRTNSSTTSPPAASALGPALINGRGARRSPAERPTPPTWITQPGTAPHSVPPGPARRPARHSPRIRSPPEPSPLTIPAPPDRRHRSGRRSRRMTFAERSAPPARIIRRWHPARRLESRRETVRSPNQIFDGSAARRIRLGPGPAPAPAPAPARDDQRPRSAPFAARTLGSPNADHPSSRASS